MYLVNIENENGENIRRHAQLFIARPRNEMAINKVDPEVKVPPSEEETFVAKFHNLRQGTPHKVVISTIYDGKEISETHFKLYTKPDAPFRVKEMKWDFAMLDNELGFELKVAWEHVKVFSEDFNRGYAVDLLQNETSLLPDEKITKENTFKYISVGSRNPDENTKFELRLWTVDMDNPSVRSPEPYLKEVPAIPFKMKNYAAFLKRRTLAENNIGYSSDSRKFGSSSTDYTFSMAVLSQVTRDLRDLARNVQTAAIEYGNDIFDKDSEEEEGGERPIPV